MNVKTVDSSEGVPASLMSFVIDFYEVSSNLGMLKMRTAKYFALHRNFVLLGSISFWLGRVWNAGRVRERLELAQKVCRSASLARVGRNAYLG